LVASEMLPALCQQAICIGEGGPLLWRSAFRHLFGFGALGSVYLIHSKPGKFSNKEQKLRKVIADELMTKFEVECRGNEISHNEPPQDNGPARTMNLRRFRWTRRTRALPPR